MAKRKFATIIEMDESVVDRFNEINGNEDRDPGEHLKQEFGQLEQSGLSIKQWVQTEEDDILRWPRYINYLFQWAMNHSGEECDGMSPACYDEWCDLEDDIFLYPLTVVMDRYNGVYSGALYTAWNLDTDEVPTSIYAGDTECFSFWEHNQIICGKGKTIEEAVEDLKQKLRSNKGAQRQ